MSHADILRELPDDYLRRMRNWARADAGTISYAMTTAYDGARGDGYDSHDPVLGGEASDTHLALMQVPLRYRQTVILYWRREGMPIVWFARRLHVESRTFEAWVRQGHTLHLVQIRIRSEACRLLAEANRATLAEALVTRPVDIAARFQENPQHSVNGNVRPQ